LCLNLFSAHAQAATCKFTSRARSGLAASIERGLEAMVADGSFDVLFQQYHGETLKRAGLDRRRVIELENPDLPPQTPFHRVELWYRPHAPQ
jgi:membrane-bound lytic murein transglycosylase MltF